MTDLRMLQQRLKALEDEIDELQDILRRLQIFNLLPYSLPRYNRIKELCNVIVSQVPFINTRVADPVVRTRKNELKLFSNESEISYNKIAPDAGRFNLKGKPIFYGSLQTFGLDNKSKDLWELSSILEVYKEIHEHPNGLARPVDFTIGMWRNTKPFQVLSLCYHDVHLFENPILRKPHDEQIKLLRDYSSKPVFEFIIKTWKFFSELSGKWNPLDVNKNYYNILTAFLEVFASYYNQYLGVDIGGVIYPGAMSEAKGLNIAIFPRFIDEKYMILHQATIYRLKRRVNSHDCIQVSDVASVEDSCFFFKKYIPTPDR